MSLGNPIMVDGSMPAVADEEVSDLRTRYNNATLVDTVDNRVGKIRFEKYW